MDGSEVAKASRAFAFGAVDRCCTPFGVLGCVPPFVSAAAVDLNNAGRRLNKRRSVSPARSLARSQSYCESETLCGQAG